MRRWPPAETNQTMTRRTARIWVYSCAVSLFSGGCAQTASDVAREYLEALAEERWADAAELVHPDTRAFVRDRIVQRMACIEAEVEAAPARADAGPPDTTMYGGIRIISSPMTASTLQDELQSKYSVASVEELEGVSPLTLVARGLESEARFAAGLHRHYPSVVLGEVPEGPIVNVLYRFDYELREEDPSGPLAFFRPPPRIVRIRRTGGRYWVTTLGGFEGSFGPGVLPTLGGPPC